MHANSTQTSDGVGNDDSDLVTIEVHYVKRMVDREAEGFDLSRDLLCSGDPEMVTPEAFATVYRQQCDVEFSVLGRGFDVDDTKAILDHVWRCHQGGRIDGFLGYDGRKTRSMAVGDLIVVDGQAFIVGNGFEFPCVGPIDELREEESR